MKVIGAILKIVAALATIAGIVYVVATYGDKIVCWAKKMLGLCDCDCECSCECEGDCDDCQCEDDCDDCACERCCAEESVPAEEAPAPAEEDPAPAEDETAVQAEEADFEG